VVTDFSSTEGDRIDLRHFDLSADHGRQGFTAMTTGEFTSIGQLRFDSATGMLYGNTDSDSSAEFALQLSGVTSLSLGDLVL
jgi:hypothetical protein